MVTDNPFCDRASLNLIVRRLCTVADLDNTLIYPQPRRESSGKEVPVILWLLLLVTAFLLLISRGPMRAPPFNALTAFTCDPQPIYQSSWMRGQLRSFLYVCKSGNHVLYQRSSIPVTGRFSAWRSCGRAKGIITIWRYRNPSPYGSYVFQSSCGGEVYASYASQSTNYSAAQTSVAIIAWGLLILSGGRLTVLGYRWFRCRKWQEGVSAV